MNIYTKLGLLALLSANALFGMEKPQPAQPTVQVENDMIQIQAHKTTIAKIERRHLKASETLKNLLSDTALTQVLELPESMINDFKAIQDYLVYEYRLQAKLADEKAILELLAKKSEQELVAIINACQRFELNELSKCAVSVLAAKLNNPERREQCLKTGSYKLELTPNSANLVGQEMIKNSNTKLYWLIKEQILNKGLITCSVINEGKSGIQKTKMFYRDIKSIVPFLGDKSCLFSELLNEKIIQQLKNSGIDATSKVIISLLSEGEHELCALVPDSLRVWHFELPSSLNYFAQSLSPEKVTLFRYCYKCAKNEAPLNVEIFPGIATIMQALPNNIQALFSSKSYWESIVIPRNAAIATAVAATAVWAASKFWKQ